MCERKFAVEYYGWDAAGYTGEFALIRPDGGLCELPHEALKFDTEAEAEKEARRLQERYDGGYVHVISVCEEQEALWSAGR